VFTSNSVHTARHVAWHYLLTALFCVFGTSVAAAQGAHEKAVFFDEYDQTLPAAFIPCLQEDVHVTGTLKTTYQVTFDGSGGAHEKFGQVTNLIGIGLESGDTYRVSGPLSYTFYTPDGETVRAEHYHNVILNVVGPGDDSKVIFLESLHLTTNANGEVIIERIDFEARCPTAQ
jgi:hypothetical protein